METTAAIKKEELESMKHFIVAQQLPSRAAAMERAEASLAEALEGAPMCTVVGSNSNKRDSQNYEDPLIRDACACPYLREFLPDQLDLDFCRITTTTNTTAISSSDANADGECNPSWVLRNPVHALHLDSQLDATSCVSTNGPKKQNTEPVLYGEEQERLIAMQTEGLSETRYPWLRQQRQVLEEKLQQVSPQQDKQTTEGQHLSQKQQVPLPLSQPPTTTLESTESTALKNSSSIDDKNSDFSVTKAAKTSSDLVNEEDRMRSLQRHEEQICTLRNALLYRRTSTTASPNASKRKALPTSGNAKKRKTETSNYKNLHSLAAWKRSKKSSVILTPEQLDAWKERQHQVQRKVQVFMEHYRMSRQKYWEEYHYQVKRQQQNRSRKPKDIKSFRTQLSPTTVFGALGGLSEEDHHRPCGLRGDELMQCLECNFVGCAPQCITTGSRQCISQHFLHSGHNFGVTCGREARIYSFQFGDFCFHDIFDNEKERLDLAVNLPFLAWKEFPVQRSFDAFRFSRLQDGGILWKGMVATYPTTVPEKHVLAARLCRQRQILFHGQVPEVPLLSSPAVMKFAALQNRRAPSSRCKIHMPVGMFNLGNTCYQSAIIQCLVHCPPLQKYFLLDIGHHYKSYQLYKLKQSPSTATVVSTSPLAAGAATANQTTNGSGQKKTEDVCLACEMDKFMLDYYGSTVGMDVLSVMEEASKQEAKKSLPARQAALLNGNGTLWKKRKTKGGPVIAAGLLTAGWKCEGMDHLAGYEQKDAHEYFHGFLDILSKHTRVYREQILKTINTAIPDNTVVPAKSANDLDIIKNLFEGTLRSVLVCQECGSKRMQSEPFMSISLPLSKEVQRATTEMPGESNEFGGRVKLSIERCLRHFTMPETLADPVDCPSCRKKTSTKKQHVISKLPKILCLHLKRFDAAQNKKIEDFVSFPATNFNLGSFLPHWCEVPRVPAAEDADAATFTPEVLYNLFATVNHTGNLTSGHYMTNVKVGGTWYHCNDAHVSKAGIDDGEVEVLKMDGTYLLFYMRS